MPLDFSRLAKKAVLRLSTPPSVSVPTTTFKAMEGLARLCPEGLFEDAFSSGDNGEP